MVQVEGGLHRIDGELVMQDPKSEKSGRTVPLPAMAVAMLRRHRVEQNERRMLAGPAWHDGGFVFDRGDGRPLVYVHPDDEARDEAAAHVGQVYASVLGVAHR